jgi:DHA2 family multidrug resistance protein
MTLQASTSTVVDGTPAAIDRRVWLGFGGIMLGQFMALLDIQIVASSLAEVQTGIDASADSISWVQTCYLLAEVVAMPATAYLTKMWGTQRFFLGAAVLFMIMSIATGLSTSLTMLVVSRTLQGLAAGGMIPPVLAIALTVFPPERRAVAIVAAGMAATLAPTIGPAVGGYITEYMGWRWLFFVNVPPGLLTLYLVHRYADFDRGDASLARTIDWWGMGLMATSVLSLQYVLEEGARHDWLQSPAIVTLVFLGLCAGGAFVLRGLTARHPLVSLQPFADRNFAIGFLVNFVVGVSLFGGTFVLPMFMSTVLHYSSGQVGATLVLSGLSLFIGGPIGGRIARNIDPRLAMALGFAVTALSLWQGARITDGWGFWDFAWLQIFRGIGVMTAMNAAQLMTTSTLAPTLMKDASALIYLVRNLGGGIGVAFLSTFLTHQTSLYYSNLIAVSAQSGQDQAMLDQLVSLFEQHASVDSGGSARRALASLLQEKAAMLAFGDAFAVLASGCLFGACLGLLVIRKSAPSVATTTR